MSPQWHDRNFEHGVASKQFRDSAVKKLLIIGLAQSTQEKHVNVSRIWSAIDLNTSLSKFIATIATDLKLANILSGMMAHSSKYPCWNSCKSLLEKIDILRANCLIGCLKFVRVLQEFHLVVKACFTNKLDPMYLTHIANFKRSYLDLGISVTPKVHAVYHHIKDFCSKNQHGLGFYSEQTIESVHHDFSTT